MNFSTTVLGLGVMSLGTSPAGLSEEVVLEGDPTPDGARYLDPVTRDYAMLDGTILRAGSTRQRVINLLVNEVQTSLSVKGIKFPRKHDDTTGRTVEGEVRRALQVLITEGAITLQAVRVRTRSENVSGRLGIVVEYIDESTGQADEVTV